MGRAKGLWVALAALALTACGPGAALDGLVDGGRAKAVAAPAGDLLMLADGRRLRLAGIEAPQPGQPYAEAARAALAKLAVGRELELLYDAPGRGEAAQLRERRTRRWLQAALLEAGAARVRTTGDDRAMAHEMLNAEARARLAGRGLWKLADYRVALPAEIGRDARGFQLVEGRIVKIGRSRGRTYLDFSDDYLNSLSVEAPAAIEAEFALAGRPIDGLVGQRVRVRGPVGGLRMRIEHPEAVELLNAPRPKTKTPGG